MGWDGMGWVICKRIAFWGGGGDGGGKREGGTGGGGGGGGKHKKNVYIKEDEWIE